MWGNNMTKDVVLAILAKGKNYISGEDIID
jgi:hypothetical protein